MSKVPYDHDEIMLVHQNGNVTYCFKEKNPEKNPNNQDYGWCRTQGNYYDPNNPDDMSTSSRQWGYCSRDCYLDTTKTDVTLRKVEKVQVRSRPSPIGYSNRQGLK